ncbi:hypothetical protein SAMN04488564_104913 [Lentzea waywayandensis]|uniref:Uncharacterized protein n=1 Tax=Lentzea waywayandensis TaxID=84724 RepID=A0A1I6EM24_9PSEU|nr:hypothetical protein [Lentzea waywayandensis]SFR18760.1 hypothetical protein SAMN04488564_104913 [Lentzea waywayandensis]
MTINLTPTQILAVVGVVVVLLWVWRASVRRAKATANAARAGARLLSLTGRVLVIAGVIVGVQWLVIAHRGDTVLLLVVLGLPALFAAYTLTKALTITSYESSRSRGDRR